MGLSLKKIIEGCRAVNDLAFPFEYRPKGTNAPVLPMGDLMSDYVGYNGVRIIESAMERIAPAMEEVRQRWFSASRFRTDVGRRSAKNPIVGLVWRAVVLLDEIRSGEYHPESNILRETELEKMQEAIMDLPPRTRENYVRWARVIRDFVWNVQPWPWGTRKLFLPGGAIYKFLLTEAKGEAEGRRKDEILVFKKKYGMSPKALLLLDGNSLERLKIQKGRDAGRLVDDLGAGARTDLLKRAVRIENKKIAESDLKEALRSKILEKLKTILVGP